jgi:4-diphosphocytidyl-2-C-methyl-D-erythritol kinase
VTEGTAVLVAAQAKVNLRLRVLAREDTGYHQIETLFLRINLTDTVRVRRTARGRSLDVSGDVDLSAIGPVEKNLAWRAALAHAEASEWRGGFAIEVEKHIPIGGGLGGGSADAGAVLRAMNAMTDVPLDTLMGLAARLGADVPFLASESAFALAWGRGDRMLALEPPPSREILLVLPGFAVNTAEAYGWIDAGPPVPGRAMVPRVFGYDELSVWQTLASVSGNDFEWFVGKRHPQIGELVERLACPDTEIAQMTGSGSTVFAVVRPTGSADSVVRRLDDGHARIIRTTSASGVEPVRPLE